MKPENWCEFGYGHGNDFAVSDCSTGLIGNPRFSVAQRILHQQITTQTWPRRFVNNLLTGLGFGHIIHSC